MVRAVAAAAVTILVCAAPARAQRADASLVVGAGYDTNPTFAASPEQRRLTTEPLPERQPDGVAAADASLQGRTGRALWTRGRLDFGSRLYFAPDTQIESRAQAELGLRARQAQLGWMLEAGRYDNSFSEDDAWAFRLRTRISVGFGAERAWSLGSEISGGLRLYDAGDQRDSLLSGGVDLSWQTHRTLLALGIDMEARQSNDPIAERTEVAPWVSAAFAIVPFEIEGRYMAFIRDFQVAPRDGLEHVVQAEVRLDLTRAFALFVSGEVGIARGTGEDALVYDRVQVLGGVRLDLTTASRSGSASEEAEPRSEESHAPATVVANGVRFRFDLPQARTVSVVGTFNDWDESRGELRRTGSGRFEGVLPAAGGHHRYHLMVDGQPVRPAGANRYVDDGFGGEDAVVVVP